MTTKPSLAKRSTRLRTWSFTPHHSWRRTTVGALPDPAGSASSPEMSEPVFDLKETRVVMAAQDTDHGRAVYRRWGGRRRAEVCYKPKDGSEAAHPRFGRLARRSRARHGV